MFASNAMHDIDLNLLNGLDDIGLTMEKAPAIASFEAKNAASRPWA